MGKAGTARSNLSKAFAIEGAFNEKLSRRAATLLRVALGTVFIAHALLKLLVFTLPGTAIFFEAHGFPGWTAYPVFAAELIGGSLLVVGLLTRLVSLALVPVMIGAFLTHYPNGWNFTAPGGGWEYVAFLTAALLAQAVLGGGAFALQILFLPGKRTPVEQAERAVKPVIVGRAS